MDRTSTRLIEGHSIKLQWILCFHRIQGGMGRSAPPSRTRMATAVDSPPPPPPPAVVLPKPTDDQWNVRRSTDGIYANVVSLPTVNPAISGVQVRLQLGATTVTATLDTTLDNRYDKVLADDSSDWQTGEWSVSIRFKNKQRLRAILRCQDGVGGQLGAHRQYTE